MRIAYKIGVLALAAVAPVLMAPSGGYPSNPNFQSVTVQGVPVLTQAHAGNNVCLAAGPCAATLNTGQSAFVWVPGDETYTLTATLTADTRLGFTSLAPGLYSLVGDISALSALGTQGFQASFTSGAAQEFSGLWMSAAGAAQLTGGAAQSWATLTANVPWDIAVSAHFRIVPAFSWAADYLGTHCAGDGPSVNACVAGASGNPADSSAWNYYGCAVLPTALTDTCSIRVYQPAGYYGWVMYAVSPATELPTGSVIFNWAAATVPVGGSGVTRVLGGSWLTLTRLE